MDKGGDMSGQAANNSSDFVRKLYKMLEDPTYEHIVRWGEGGESFVVLENEKFTKMILPKHFKHSNFASFVRQLNKYDFHKVRQNNEDNTPSPYGANAWEFKHPEFQANKKDSLDNIRRKAPAPRKQAASMEEQGFPSQQMDLVNSQLIATQQQLQHLSERYQDLAQGHIVLLQQVVQLQKFVKAHDGVMHKVLPFLQSVDASQRRNSRIAFPPGAPGMMGDQMGIDPIDDHPASPLQRASELLDEFNAENLPNKELEQMTHAYHMRNEYVTSTPPDHGSSIMAPQSEGSIAYPGSNDLDDMVYPVGHTNGIDPINSEHINNIPYALPLNRMIPVDPMVSDVVPEIAAINERKKSMVDTVWGPTKPRILLVEDDKVCARIGSKFLQAFECGVETAADGLEAVNMVNHSGNQFDLILMDIIMPHLDGVSATVCIREVRPDVPIIAMTSNIRTDDIDMYFRYAMNDVLPKPFTKEGMLRALEKHLPQFRKGATPAHFLNGPMQSQAGFAAPNPRQQPPLGLNMGQMAAAHAIKDDPSPGKSPATATSWNSPIQIPGPSPINPQGPYMQQGNGYAMTPTHPGFPPNAAMGVPRAPPQQHRRVMSEMAGGPPPDEHIDKRQRMFAAQPGNFPQ